MSSELDTVLGAIEGLRSDVREDQAKIWDEIKDLRECEIKTKLKVEKLTGRHEVLRNEVKHVVKSTDEMDEHMSNDEVHFDKEKAKTTTLGYLAKKRVLVIFLTALGIIVSTATGLVVAWMNGLFSGG